MVESLPKEFVCSWGSIKECKFHGTHCKGSGLTVIMMRFKDIVLCATCFAQLTDQLKSQCSPVANDAKFKCPEKNCDKKLYFHEFIARNCCEKSVNKSILKNGLPENHENHRTEFHDLKMMMNLLELSEKEENEARKIMQPKEKDYESAKTFYKEKEGAREESRSNLASSLMNASLFIAEDEDKTEASKLQELKILMETHETIIKEEEVAKKKMNEDKEALDKATDEYMKKKEKREQVRNDLSSSFINTAKDLIKTEEAKEKDSDKCNVCFEKYNKIDRHSCAPKCGHLTCQKCLNELPEKLCPICREPFTEENIIKVFLS